jgi:CubicO group peptidase (beta-lactamase class C family)
MQVATIRTKAIALAAAFTLMLSEGAAAAQERLPGALENYIRQSMAQAEVPGLAVAVVRPGAAPIAQGFGVRRLGRSEPVDGDTVFNIASLAKSFTAASAAVLVDDGKLGWNDRVAHWLPQVEFKDPWLTEHVTLADLLSHRTGLHSANTAWYFADVDRAEILRRVRYLTSAAPFRTEQVYNNGLYVVAGEAIAAAAGISWEDHVRARLCSRWA